MRKKKDLKRLIKKTLFLKSYLIAKQLFGARDIREKLYSQDYIMDAESQYKLIGKLEYTLYASTKWMVKYLKKNQHNQKETQSNNSFNGALYIFLGFC